jgi:hypothetical protein
VGENRVESVTGEYLGLLVRCSDLHHCISKVVLGSGRPAQRIAEDVRQANCLSCLLWCAMQLSLACVLRCDAFTLARIADNISSLAAFDGVPYDSLNKGVGFAVDQAYSPGAVSATARSWH